MWAQGGQAHMMSYTVVPQKSTHLLLLARFFVKGQRLLEWAPTLEQALHGYRSAFIEC